MSEIFQMGYEPVAIKIRTTKLKKLIRFFKIVALDVQVEVCRSVVFCGVLNSPKSVLSTLVCVFQEFLKVFGRPFLKLDLLEIVTLSFFI